jgi:hypothetical protein
VHHTPSACFRSNTFIAYVKASVCDVLLVGGAVDIIEREVLELGQITAQVRVVY